MSLFINADDFGLSDGANRRILDAFDKQVLHGASLLPNGSAFDSAVREYRKRPGFVLSVHLNLVEGKPVSSPQDIPLLLDAKGYLNCSFGKLIALYVFSTSKRRKALLEQLAIEMRAQVAKIKAVLHPKAPLRVDSHTHTHMLPFVFRTLAELTKAMDISYIRVPNEQFFFFTGHVSFWKVYFGTGLIKLFLLKYLSGGAAKTCRGLGIKTCDHFVGVLFTGSMTLGVTKAALKKISPLLHTEVLFHPGRPDDHEKLMWKGRERYLSYYYNDWRIREFDTLLSPEFKAFLISRGTDERISRSG